MTEFQNVDFDAKLAIDNEAARNLVEYSAADGFSLSSTPLFKVRDMLERKNLTNCHKAKIWRKII